MGSKIFVNFTRYEFNECIRRLRVELDGVFKTNTTPNQPANIIVSTSTNRDENNLLKKVDVNQLSQSGPAQNKVDQVLKWSESDAEKWLKQTDTHPNILANIRPCDGKILYELFLIKRDSPDFFYRSLSANFLRRPVFLRDLAAFSNELRRLFTN